MAAPLSIRIPPLTSGSTPKYPNLVLTELDNGIKEEIRQGLKDEYGKLSWFALGLALGSILDFFTVIVMFCIGILIDNRPLPTIFGDITPRELVANLIKSAVRMTHKLAKGRE